MNFELINEIALEKFLPVIYWCQFLTAAHHEDQGILINTYCMIFLPMMEKKLETIVRETLEEFDVSVEAAAQKFGIDRKEAARKCYQGYALW